MNLLVVITTVVLQAAPEVVSAKDDPRECKVVLDAKGQPRLAWTSGPEVITKELTVATRGAGGKDWVPRAVGTCGVRCNTSLSIDKKGLLRASFSSTCEGTAPENKCIRVAELGPKQVTMFTTPVTLNGGFSTSHRVDDQGTIHLGFGAHDEKVFAYGVFTKGVWSRGSTPKGDEFDFDSRFELALKKKGTVTALFDDRSKHVIYARWEGREVTTETLPTEGPARGAAFALGPDDVPHAAFTLNDNQVAHAVRSEKGWAIDVVAKAGSGAVVDVTMAVGRDGAVHLAWYEPALGTLRYATRAVGANEWTVETIAGTRSKQAGLDPSLAVDATGAAHLCFQALAEKSVKYVKLEPKKK